ncbi:MAG: Coenzyme F420 hydrogenase/dehydrogenase, beta subunit C-terminal domain [Mangrovibacterium sp.]
MKNSNANIFDSVINQDLCVGCGACLYKNSSNDLKMDWNDEGFLVPIKKNDSVILVTSSIQVCPFNPYPSDEIRTEDELANLFLKDVPNFHPKLGRYSSSYVGYSEQYRLTSSSGGIATYFLSELFEQKIVDAVIAVGEGINNHYEYKLIKRKEDLLSISKTKYYPVSMADALKELENFDGKVAVVGVGCFIKAVRLLQHYNPLLCDKIVFTVGIICGGLKSRFFCEYLAAKAGVENNEFTKPQFRIKDYDSTAGDYSFGCVDKEGKEKQVKMRTVGDMWGSRMFNAMACDFCDDVTTELADVSLGDAWFNPYIEDGEGTNVIIVRSSLALKILSEGNEMAKLHLETLDLSIIIDSQSGSYNHRQTGLPYRIKQALKRGQFTAPKRYDLNSVMVDFKIVQNYRMKVRKKSLELWGKYKNAEIFDMKIDNLLCKLRKATNLYHFRRIIFMRNLVPKVIKYVYRKVLNKSDR